MTKEDLIMGKLLIFLGILGIVGGVLIGVLGAFGSGFGFGGFQDAINAAVNGEETAAALCKEGETLDTERGASSYTQGMGWAASVSYYCVNSDGERREVTGEFAQTLFGSVSNALPGLLGGIGLSALLSTCGTGLLILGIIVAITRGRRGAMQVVTPQSYMAGADLNSILAAKARQMPSATVVSSSASGGDLTARLEQLKAAFDKKLISQEEYDRARKAILNEMK
jgi:hypothetical protein